MLNGNEVEMNFKAGEIKPIAAFELITKVLQHPDVNEEFIEAGKNKSIDQIRRKIEKNGKWGSLETENLYFQYGIAGAYDHCFVLIREKNKHIISDWNEIASIFCSQVGFVQGWVSDVEYSYWQNAKDLMLYELNGKDFSSLPLKSNGLPPPLEESEVDISKNPGRSILRDGYVESVGVEMWLGDLFWEKVKSNRNSLEKEAHFILIENFCAGVIKIQVKNQEFTSDKTAETQNALRSALYRT